MNPIRAYASARLVPLAMAAAPAIALTVAACHGSSSGCDYKVKNTFCFSPPPGVKITEKGDSVLFEHTGKVRPAQELSITTTAFTVDAAYLKQKRDYEKKGSGSGKWTILENIDLAGGRGFAITGQTANMILAKSVVLAADGKSFAYCYVSAYTADKDGVKADLQACKTLRPAD